MNRVIVSILDFGASTDGSLQTEKIQSAIDYCFKQGGGEVRIPEGVYHTGGLRLRSNVCLHLLENAVLRGSKNPEDYFSYKNDTVEPLGKTVQCDVVGVMSFNVINNMLYSEIGVLLRNCFVIVFGLCQEQNKKFVQMALD